MRPRLHLVYAASVTVALCIGCGGAAGPKTVKSRVERLDVNAMLLEHATGHSRNLHRPDEELTDLELQRRKARGKERHALSRRLAVAHMFEAEQALGLKATRRHQRAAIKLAAEAAKVMKDPWDRAELAFVRMWSVYRMGRPTAAKVVSHFIKRHRVSAELVVVAWLVQAELDYGRRRFKQAERSYRYVVAMAPHPLYGLSLYRTAQCYEELDRIEDMHAAFTQIVQLGCAEDERSVHDDVLSNAAAQEREKLVRIADGRLFPKRCAPKPPEEG